MPEYVPPSWVRNQVDSHINHLVSWTRMFGAVLLTPEHRTKLMDLVGAENDGERRITHPIVWGEGEFGQEHVEEEPGCKT